MSDRSHDLAGRHDIDISGEPSSIMVHLAGSKVVGANHSDGSIAIFDSKRIDVL